MGIHMPMWSVASDLESLTNFQLILGNRLSHLDEGDAGLWVSHSSDKFWDCPLGRLGLPSGDLTNTVFFFFFSASAIRSQQAQVGQDSSILRMEMGPENTHPLCVRNEWVVPCGERKPEVSGEILSV